MVSDGRHHEKPRVRRVNAVIQPVRSLHAHSLPFARDAARVAVEAVVKVV